MKHTIKTFTGKTVVIPTIGKAVDTAIHKAFIGKVTMPLQMVLGKAIAELNLKGLVTNNVLTGHNMDAMLAENAHSLLVEKTINSIMEYLVGYGTVYTNRTQKRGKWTTHWIITLNPGIFKLMEKEDKGFKKSTLKKLRNAAVQSMLSDNLGVNTDVKDIDAKYLDGLKQQYVEYNLNEDELAKHLTECYSESELMATNKVKYTPTKKTKGLVESHYECLKALDGKRFPLTEKLEPRGRTAKMQHSLLGLNLYGKTWETQSFKLGEKTVAYDARQSGYGILGVLLGVKPLAKITGIYGKTGTGDIYTGVFAEVLKRVFNRNDIDRLVAKKPAQMLAYMAGMKSILLEDDLGLGSIWHHLAPEGADLDDYCAMLEIELWAQPELTPIMEMREAVRDGQFANYAVPTWNFPETSDYFFTRSDTNFLSWGKGGMSRDASIFMVVGDDNKQHQMTMHISIIREYAKASAILAAIIHSLDALLKKLVCLDVWEAGGKILVKHDEFIVDEEHADVMFESYHRWMAYLGTHRTKYLSEPLEACGYSINLDAMVNKNKERFGEFHPWMVATARDGLAYEWTV